MPRNPGVNRGRFGRAYNPDYSDAYFLSGEDNSPKPETKEMVEFCQGDILQAEAEALVNPVNCVGVMGRGLALQFKKAYPGNFKKYKVVCDCKLLYPGKMLFYDTKTFEAPRCIVNFPTKRHWKDGSRLEYIEAGLKALMGEICRRDIYSVAIPSLGCGLGGLDWAVVLPMIKNAFEDLPNVRVLLFEPKEGKRK